MGRVSAWIFGVFMSLAAFVAGTLTALGVLPAAYGVIITVALGLGAAAGIAQGLLGS